MSLVLPTPHFEKLKSTLENEKLPPADKPVIAAAIQRYGEWVKRLTEVTGESVEAIVNKMVALLNEYRLYLDVEVIFGREADFLYRQKGQLKLDNSVIEEFLPHLVCKCRYAGARHNRNFSWPEYYVFVNLFRFQLGSYRCRRRTHGPNEGPRFRCRKGFIFEGVARSGVSRRDLEGVLSRLRCRRVQDEPR